MGNSDDVPKVPPAPESATSLELPSSTRSWERMQQVLPLAGDVVAPPRPPRRPLFWYLTRTRIDSAERLAIHLDRARELGRPATLTGREWLEALMHFKKRCAYCDSVIATVIEHFVPLKRDWGGGTTAGNCVPSCTGCNGSKTVRGPSWVLEQWGPIVYHRVQSYLEPRMTEDDRAAAEWFDPVRRARELVELAKLLGDNGCLVRLLGWSLSTLRLYASDRKVPDALALLVRELRPKLDAHSGTAEEFTVAIEAEREQQRLASKTEPSPRMSETGWSVYTFPGLWSEVGSGTEGEEVSRLCAATPPPEPSFQDKPDDDDDVGEEEAPRAAEQLRLFEDPKPSFPWRRR